MAPPQGVPLSLLVLCTGNVARSVMATAMLRALAPESGWEPAVADAGTLAVEGQSVGGRTARALAEVGLPVDPWPWLAQHRSHQLVGADLVGVELVVAMEAGHVRSVRRTHPEAADRTGMLRQLVATLPSGPEPLADRVGGLHLGAAVLDDTQDVLDPAGGDDEAYLACARELWGLTRALFPRLLP